MAEVAKAGGQQLRGQAMPSLPRGPGSQRVQNIVHRCMRTGQHGVHCIVRVSAWCAQAGNTTDLPFIALHTDLQRRADCLPGQSEQPGEQGNARLHSQRASACSCGGPIVGRYHASQSPSSPLQSCIILRVLCSTVTVRVDGSVEKTTERGKLRLRHRSDPVFDEGLELVVDGATARRAREDPRVAVTVEIWTQHWGLLTGRRRKFKVRLGRA